MVPTVGDSTEYGTGLCKFSLNTVKKTLVLQISVVPWGDRRQLYTNELEQSVLDGRLTFILSAALKYTQGLEVCRYLMKLASASVQINSQGPATAWKEKAHMRAMQSFMFPVQGSSWIFSRMLQNFCWCYHCKGQDLCPHIHRGINNLFYSYPAILPRHLRSLLNKKASGRKTSSLLWLWATLPSPSVSWEHVSNKDLLPEFSSVMWFQVSVHS